MHHRRISLPPLFLNDIAIGEDAGPSTSLFSQVLASVPIAPLPLTTLPPPTPEVEIVEAVSLSDGVNNPDASTTLLKRRISELERSLEARSGDAKRISALEAELRIERVALQEAREANDLLSADISELQADVMRARKELYDTLNQQIPNEGVPEKIQQLEAENERLRKFIGIVVSSGGHKPVLQRAFDNVADGRDPEEALLDAIRDAILQQDSIWKTLLEPVLGPRSQAEYLAQVNCTLRARRDVRDWRKRARFWKINAKDDGRHEDTVTPSVSQLSDIVEVLSPERQKALDALVEKLRFGNLQKLEHAELAEGGEPSTRALDVVGPHSVTNNTNIAPSTSYLGSTPLSPIKEADGEMVASDRSSVGRSLATTGPPLSLRPISTITSISPSVNLAPLASVTFRESNSIKTSSSKHRRDSFASLLALTPSASTSSHTSQRSASRKTLFMGLVRPSQSNLAFAAGDQQRMQPLTEECLTTAPSLEPSMESNAPLTLGDDVAQHPEAVSTIISPSGSGSGSSTSDRTPRASILSTVGSQSQHQINNPPLTPTRLDFGLPPSMLTLSPHTPTYMCHPSSVERFEEQRSPTPSPNRTPLASPNTKKSRLPVLKMTSLPLQKTMRRLSISKPVLVDSTNAAATLTSCPERVTKNRFKKTRGQENAVVGRRGKSGKTTEKDLAGASPSKKVHPMRFALGQGLGSKVAK